MTTNTTDNITDKITLDTIFAWFGPCTHEGIALREEGQLRFGYVYAFAIMSNVLRSNRNSETKVVDYSAAKKELLTHEGFKALWPVLYDTDRKLADMDDVEFMYDDVKVYMSKRENDVIFANSLYIMLNEMVEDANAFFYLLTRMTAKTVLLFMHTMHKLWNISKNTVTFIAKVATFIYYGIRHMSFKGYQEWYVGDAGVIPMPEQSRTDLNADDQEAEIELKVDKLVNKAEAKASVESKSTATPIEGAVKQAVTTQYKASHPVWSVIQTYNAHMAMGTYGQSADFDHTKASPESSVETVSEVAKTAEKDEDLGGKVTKIVRNEGIDPTFGLSQNPMSDKEILDQTEVFFTNHDKQKGELNALEAVGACNTSEYNMAIADIDGILNIELVCFMNEHDLESVDYILSARERAFKASVVATDGVVTDEELNNDVVIAKRDSQDTLGVIIEHDIDTNS